MKFQINRFKSTGLYVLLLFSFMIMNFESSLGQTAAINQDLPADPEERLQIYIKTINKYLDSGDPGIEEYIKNAYQDFALIGFKKGMGRIQNRIGEISLTRGAFSTAYDAYSRGKIIFEEIGDEENLAYSISGLGTAEGRRGNYEQCNEILLKALELFEKQNNKHGVGSVFLKLGTLNVMLNNPERSLDYFERALPYALETDTFNVITIYNNIGGLTEGMVSRENSIPYYEKALALAQGENYEIPRILALHNLGMVLFDFGQKQKAMAYLDEALRLTNKHKLLEEKLTITLNRHKLIGTTKNESLRLDLDSIYQQSLEKKLYSVSDVALTQLINYHKSKEDQKKVIDYLEQQNRIRTLSYDQNRALEIARFQSNFDLQQSQKDIDNLVDQVNSQRKEKIYIGIITLILLISIFLLVRFLYIKSKMNRELLAIESELRNANTVKDRLFSIIGHDLTGGLAAQSMGIQLLRTDYKRDQMSTILDSMDLNLSNLTELLDSLLNWGKLQLKGAFYSPKEIKLNPIIDDLLQKYKHSAAAKNITLINDIKSDATIFADLDQVTFISRNLINNAIKFSNSNGNIWIGLTASTDGSKKVFSVRDDGVGINKGEEETIFNVFNTSKPGTTGETGNSLALMICKQFVQLNKGRIWAERNEIEGSTFYVEFPIREV